MAGPKTGHDIPYPSPPDPLTALVTGSSRGIGAAIAAGLRVRGVKVIGHATRAVDADTIAADLTDPTAAAAIWEQALDRS
ncbi:MAG TPA: hypothetical protein PK680_11485, partial [Novosphingobium sp.]|nr:hypothetical protein [Novosphingobium sp.]